MNGVEEPTDEVSGETEAGQVSDGDVSDDEVVDVLPEDLDASAAVVVEFPNNNRRRVPAVLYLLMGLGAVAASIAQDGSPNVNTGLAVAGGLLALVGLYGLAAGRTLLVDETDALVAASATVGFPIGHASAQMSWRGLLSRPVWRLLAYSAEDPPARRAMVVVGGISGVVIEWFAEVNPEDWSSLS
jgi:hypothetical protein